MGTPEFSVPPLEALVAAGHDVCAVYTQPPRPAGRGKKDRPSAVQQRAKSLGIPVRTPKSLKSDTEAAAFDALKADVGVVVAYGLILPKRILEAPKMGCLNIHASLLPRWRGAAPIHRAIMAGDSETGVTIMQMDAGLDTGPVLLSHSLPIDAEETTASLHDKLSDLGARLIIQTLERVDRLKPLPQPDKGVTYAHKIDKDEARIDWRGNAVDIDRQIRGLSPFPGAWTAVGDERLRLLGSRTSDGEGPPGTHLGDFRIACGTGAVQVTWAQRQGKRPMPAVEVLRGLTLPDRLS